MILGIIGCGAVGGALKRWFEKNTTHTLRLRDPALDRDDSMKDCEAVFIAVPVPTDPKSGDQDLSILKQEICFLTAPPQVPVFIKSTVLPGTCNHLTTLYSRPVIAMPEFLTERTADADFEAQPVVCGGATMNAWEILLPIFQGKELLVADSTEAEIAKYAHNCFCAMKVGFFNIIRELCRRTGANYENVLHLANTTGFVGTSHTKVPGPDGKFGFGGKCLTKDLLAFTQFLHKEKIVGAWTLTEVLRDNEPFRNATGEEVIFNEKDKKQEVQEVHESEKAVYLTHKEPGAGSSLPAPVLF